MECMIIHIFESLFLSLIRYIPSSVFTELCSTKRRSIVFHKLSIEFYAFEIFLVKVFLDYYMEAFVFSGHP